MKSTNRDTPACSQANFANGTIWTGDNLYIMRGINSECIDLIYLDPPFNSNKDYSAPIGSEAAGAAFKDTWTLSDIDVHEHGELADRSPAAYSVIEAARQAYGKSMQSYLIMMAVRLLEMKRILKSTGSIYLHCDPTASHYLKLLMDGIFSVQKFQTEITWKRTYAHGDRVFSNTTDTILFYGKPCEIKDDIRVPLSKDYVDKQFRYEDSRGRYQAITLNGPKVSSGESGSPWKGIDPSLVGRCWSVPRSGRYAKYIDEELIPGYLEIEGVHSRLNALDDAGLIHWPKNKNGTPRLKRYLRPNDGQLPSNIWTDISPISRASKEQTGYPTQKPLALLTRIILASTDIGDMVFDPFCGCATTLVAADRLQRQWAGVDLSPLAIKLVNERISKDRGLFGGATALDIPPKRTDIGELPNYRTHRHRLYGEQEGVCAGCDTHFPFRVMDVDHILPTSRGGTDHLDNLQLLCSGCNRSKGKKTMAEWRATQ